MSTSTSTTSPDRDFYRDVIVRRAQQRAAYRARLAGDSTVTDEAIGRVQSGLNKTHRRALAAQLRNGDPTVSIDRATWTAAQVSEAKGETVIDEALIAQAKTEAKVRRAAWSDLQKVAKARATFAI